MVYGNACFFVIGFRIMLITFEPTSPSKPDQFYSRGENITLTKHITMPISGALAPSERLQYLKQ